MFKSLKKKKKYMMTIAYNTCCFVQVNKVIKCVTVALWSNSYRGGVGSLPLRIFFRHFLYGFRSEYFLALALCCVVCCQGSCYQAQPDNLTTPGVTNTGIKTSRQNFRTIVTFKGWQGVVRLRANIKPRQRQTKFYPDTGKNQE
mgnify:CR=1 FL=1